MTTIRVLVSRFLDLVFSGRRERRLDEEIRTHLDLLTEQYVAAGMPADAARRAARRAFGGVDQMKEHYRDQRGLPFADVLLQDVRFAMRLMQRNRAFTFTAVLVLGLGIGVNNMLFTILNAHTLRGLPIPGSGRVLFLSSVDDRGRDRGLSFADYLDLSAAAERFEGIGAFQPAPMVLAGDGHSAERLDGAFVTANAFELIRARAELGRLFGPADDRPGAAPGALISRAAWHGRYGADPAVVGRAVTVNGTAATVIGIVPDRSGFPSTAAVWMPLWQAPGLSEQRRDARTLQVFGRVAADHDPEAAIVEVAGVGNRIAAAHQDTNRNVRLKAVPINSRFLGNPNDGVWRAFITVGFIIVLISCANVANLMIDRSLQRSHELAIRACVGGSRWRLVRQLVVEGVVLAVCGGAVGLGVAIAGVRLFRRAIPADALPYWFDYSPDWRVLAALAAVSMMTVIVFALVPALQASRTDIVGVLKAGGRSLSFRRRAWSSLFLGSQVALAVVLLAHFAVNLRGTSVGLPTDAIFDDSRIVTAATSLPHAGFPGTAQRAAFYDRLLMRLERDAWIDAAAIVNTLPGSGGDLKTVSLEGSIAPGEQAGGTTLAIAITPGYFRVLGLNLLQGRDLDDADGRAGARNAIVNQRFVEKYLAGDAVLGRRVGLRADEGPAGSSPAWLTVVGVAPDIRQRRQAEAEPIVYTPLLTDAPAGASVMVRSHLEAAPVVTALRQHVQALDTGLPIFRARTLPQVRDDLVWNGRVSSNLFTFLTFIAVALATVGLYAVTAYAVSQERREIGIRVAIGARTRQVVGRVVSRLAAQTALGFAAGVVCTMAWDRAFPGPAAGVRATDPESLAIVAGILLAVVALAAVVPSRRAARVDPLVALRTD